MRLLHNVADLLKLEAYILEAGIRIKKDVADFSVGQINFEALKVAILNYAKKEEKAILSEKKKEAIATLESQGKEITAENLFSVDASFSVEEYSKYLKQLEVVGKARKSNPKLSQ